MKEVELIPDARNLMESTRSIGYSLPAAVADLVDNSIAAEASQVEIWTPTSTEPHLLILDDGFGMTADELQTAMRYGSRFVMEERTDRDLGRFGLGLKMASLSQCRRLTVLSKKKDGCMVGARWDLDHIAVSKCPWALQVLEGDDFAQVPWSERLAEAPNGTLVVWENLDVLLMGINEKSFSTALLTRISDLKSHLALVFHRYIDGEAGESFRLIFNNDEVKPIDPFLKQSSHRPFAADSFMLAGQRIAYEPFVLPHPKNLTEEDKRMAGDLLKDQGFYIYRNKRLVIWGTWFRLSRKLSLSKLARVQVDIPASAELDHLWSLDVKKSSANIPEELRNALRTVVEKLAVRSGNVWKRRAMVQRSKDAFWLREKNDVGDVTYRVNEENPVVKAFIDENASVRVLLQLISSRLPLDSLYTDLGGDKVVAVAENPKDLIEKLRELGFDPGILER